MSRPPRGVEGGGREASDLQEPGLLLQERRLVAERLADQAGRAVDALNVKVVLRAATVSRAVE